MNGSSGVSFELTVEPLTGSKEGMTHRVDITLVHVADRKLKGVTGLEGKYNRTVDWFTFSDKSQNDLVDCLLVIFPSAVVTGIFNLIQSLVLLNIEYERTLR
jgi:hypothetical protein